MVNPRKVFKQESQLEESWYSELSGLIHNYKFDSVDVKDVNGRNIIFGVVREITPEEQAGRVLI